LKEFSQVSIKAGSLKVSEGQTLTPQLITVHKDYQVQTLSYD